jgi:hypothetical protein
MYKKILFALFVLSLSTVANSEFVLPDSLTREINKLHLNLGYQIGFGTYSMNSLKNINDQISESLPFDSKVIDNFPRYLYFRPSVCLESAKHTIGFIWTFQSTGSRISAKDFSGEYRFDTKVRSTAPGIYGDIKIFSHKKSRLCIYSIVGLVFSKLNTHEFVTLKSGQGENQSIDFKALNYFLEPGVVYSYSIGSFSVGLNAGYFITFGSQAFYRDDNKKNTLYDSKNQQDVRPDWNGIRAGFSILYSFRSKQ